MQLSGKQVLKWGMALALLVLPACGLLPQEGADTVPAVTRTAETALTPFPAEEQANATVTVIVEIPKGKVTATLPPIKLPAATQTSAPSGPFQSQKIETRPFQIQAGSPKYIPAFPHADEGCTWVGLAGQVLHENGAGAVNLAVLVTGTIAGQDIVRASLTMAESPFGPGGYEVFLAARPGRAGEAVIVQLYNLASQPISVPFKVALPASCDQNLALVNFQSQYEANLIFLPLISNLK